MYILLKAQICLKNSLMKRYSGITGVFLKKSDQMEEFREKKIIKKKKELKPSPKPTTLLG